MKIQDLLTEFPSHVFTVYAKEKGQPIQHDGVPKYIYLRHEIDKGILYVDSRFITQAYLVEEAIAWRSTSAYCGTLLKRISAGSGKKDKPCYCLVFDLSYGKMGDATHRISKRGARLQVARVAEYKVKAKVAAVKMQAVSTRIKTWEATYGHLPLWAELEATLKEAKRFYEDSYIMLSSGRRKKILPEPSPIKTVKVEIKPAESLVRCAGLDELIQRDARFIYRNVRSFIIDEQGKLTMQEQEFKPLIRKEEWMGRYEQGEEKDGSANYKHLYIPVAILKSGAYKHEDILNYKNDFRFAHSCPKYVGTKMQRCALFDLNRKPLDIIEIEE
jgi:hypothetical protein